MRRSYKTALLLATIALILISSFSNSKSASATILPVPAPTPPDVCPSHGTPFETPITAMPFPSPTPHRIDELCPLAGKNDHNDDHRLQNAIKNNFTAGGSAVVLTFDDFAELQKATDEKITNGDIKLSGVYPKKRLATLKNQITIAGKKIGEGTMVTIEAYVYGAHYSNTKFNRYQHNQRGSGEANNCSCNRVDWNDIHIALVENVADSECSSVTAEISPHYRSVLWSKFHDGRISEIEHELPGILRHKVIQGSTNTDQPLKVRITGPLFYDASHGPCRFNPAGAVIERNSPARRTIWEIHPVYRIQVYEPTNHHLLDLDEWVH